MSLGVTSAEDQTHRDPKENPSQGLPPEPVLDPGLLHHPGRDLQRLPDMDPGSLVPGTSPGRKRANPIMMELLRDLRRSKLEWSFWATFIGVSFHFCELFSNLV